MRCHRCGSEQLRIQPAEDSFNKEVRCLACDWHAPLKYFNKKTKKI